MTFLEKYELLKKSIPVPATITFQSVDCEYGDILYNSKNCYHCFISSYLEDGIYTSNGFWSNKVVDCTFVAESEKCYQCIDSTKCHNCTYLMDCNSCTGCHFSAMLNACADCFGCVGLTHKKYCIFNKQYTKEEYFKKVEELRKQNPEKLLKQMFDLKRQIPHPANQQLDNENCLYGNYIYNSKNNYWCFNTFYGENSGYIFISVNAKSCWDLYYSGSADRSLVAERCYELALSRSLYNCAFLYFCQYCTNCYYSAYLKNCSDCFGCVDLANKKYCVLNNQLTKEQYEKAVKEIKKELGWKF